MPPVGGEDSALATPLWWVHGGKGAAFVDLQNDVTTKDIELARLEGYGASEHVKRYTTLGMGTDQGKTANVTALGVLSELTGAPIQRSAPLAFVRRIRQSPGARSPGIIAARISGQGACRRRMPGLRERRGVRRCRTLAQGAMVRAPGRDLAAKHRAGGSGGAALGRRLRCLDARQDRHSGPDAATLLDRVYTNKFSTLKVGRARYGLMLREDGFAMDDGTTARLGEQHFIMTTTTANAGKVMQHLEFCRQVLWPELDVRLVSVSDHWAQYAVAGPRSRDVLAKLVDAPFDISNEGFPRMGRASSPYAAASRRGCSASLLRRDGTRSPCRRVTATPRSAR